MSAQIIHMADYLRRKLRVSPEDVDREIEMAEYEVTEARRLWAGQPTPEHRANVIGYLEAAQAKLRRLNAARAALSPASWAASVRANAARLGGEAAKGKPRCCAVCQQPGHNRQTCTRRLAGSAEA